MQTCRFCKLHMQMISAYQKGTTSIFLMLADIGMACSGCSLAWCKHIPTCTKTWMICLGTECVRAVDQINLFTLSLLSSVLQLRILLSRWLLGRMHLLPKKSQIALISSLWLSVSTGIGLFCFMYDWPLMLPLWILAVLREATNKKSSPQPQMTILDC